MFKYIAAIKGPHNQSYHSGISFGTRPTNTVWIHRYWKSGWCI